MIEPSASTQTKAQPTLRAALLDNVQFIYELALAQMELDAFSVDYEVTNGLRQFALHNVPDIGQLVRRLAYFKSIDGRATDYAQIIGYNRTRSVNQYLTHWIYPYKGKFHPQMIRALLNILGLKRGEVVLDPFVGSGTTAVEAQLLGIDCVGVDISPLCVLQSRVKTQSVHAVEQIAALTPHALASFVEETAPLRIGGALPLSYQSFLDSVEDARARDFFLMAALVAISDHERRRRNLIESFRRNLMLMVHSIQDYRRARDKLGLQLGDVRIERADARRLPLPDESVDGVITSPPYSIALDYVANDAHSLQALGYDLTGLRDSFVGVRGRGDAKIRLYNEDMQESLREIYRVLRTGKHCAIVLGNATYNGHEVKTIQFALEFCAKLGFRLVSNVNKIIFGLYNVMQTDNTLIFRKE